MRYLDILTFLKIVAYFTCRFNLVSCISSRSVWGRKAQGQEEATWVYYTGGNHG